MLLAEWNFGWVFEGGLFYLVILDANHNQDEPPIGNKIWAALYYGIYEALYLDIQQPIDENIADVIEIPAIGGNYRFYNDFLYVKNFDDPTKWHKLWTDKTGELYFIWIDPAETLP